MALSVQEGEPLSNCVGPNDIRPIGFRPNDVVSMDISVGVWNLQPEPGLLSNSSSLAVALSVTKFIGIVATNLFTLWYVKHTMFFKSGWGVQRTGFRGG